MFFTLGLALLFFLPVIESFDRNLAFDILMIGSIMISLSTFWKKKLAFDFIELLWVMMLIIFTLSATLSLSLSRSYIELLRYFAYFLIFVSIRRFPEPDLLLKRFFIPMVIVNSFILSFLAIIYWIPFFHLSPPEGGMNLFYFSSGHNRLSDLLLFTVPITIVLAMKKNSKLLKLLQILVGIFFMASLVATLARGALIALLFALFFFLFRNKNYRGWYPWITSISVISIVFLTSSFIFSNFLVNIEKGKQYPIFIYKNAQSENRLNYSKQGFDNFLANHVFGTGLDTFRYVSRINSASPSAVTWYTHNHYLQIFSETGFLGGFIFVSLILSFIFLSFRNNQQSTNNNQLYWGIFIAVIASAIHSLIDYDWQYLSIFLIFWISLGLLSPSVFVKNNYQTGHDKCILPKILITLIFVMFIFPIVYQINTDNLLNQADLLTGKKELREALNILQKTFRLDSKNSEVTWRLANLYTFEKNNRLAHDFNQKTILLYPFNSMDVIRNDMSLYLKEAMDALDKKKYQEGFDSIMTSIKLYPFYHQFIGGDFYIYNAQKLMKAKDNIKASIVLKEYIKKMQKLMNNKKLSEEEINFIKRNLTAIVY